MLSFKMASLHFILKKYFTLIKYNKKQNPPPPPKYTWHQHHGNLMVLVLLLLFSLHYYPLPIKFNLHLHS